MKKLVVTGMLLMLLILGCLGNSSSTTTRDGGFYTITYPSSWSVEENRDPYMFDLLVSENPSVSLIIQRLEYSEDFDDFSEYESLEESLNDEGERIVSSRTTTFNGVRSLELTRTIDDQSGQLKDIILYVPQEGYVAVINYEYYVDEEAKVRPVMADVLKTLTFR